MANDLNQCNFIGRLGRDPEVRYMPNGEAVASFSIAVGSSWKDKNSGDKKELTEWVNLTAFRQLAEVCGKYLKKGSKIFVTARVKTDKYQKDGVDMYSTKFVIENMQMLDGKPADGSAGSSDDYGGASAARPSGNAGGNARQKQNFSDMDDDIPF